ncbi:MAG TPA: hypothetical protein VJ797_15540 [Burkholderiales bacterium]|nr:hypothetical protein [Burkholderiales bacterium]
MNGLDPLRNQKDPLHKSGPEAERELFRALSNVCNGFPNEAVVGAAVNMLVNAIRQSHSTRQGAADALDQLVAKVRILLLDQHYDALGNRRNVFPFHQKIEVPHMDLRSIKH